MDSVREQAEVALAANFDPTLKTADLQIPSTLYSGKDPFLAQLRAKIQKAEKIKLEARHLDRKADVLLGKTKEELVEKDLTDKTPARSRASGPCLEYTRRGWARRGLHPRPKCGQSTSTRARFHRRPRFGTHFHNARP